jgi:hypothetical protein
MNKKEEYLKIKIVELEVTLRRKISENCIGITILDLLGLG